MERSQRVTFPHSLGEGFWVVGNYYFNLYVAAGEQATALIEVGVSAVVDEVIRQLDCLNLRPTFLIVTHPHADHLTGLAGLQEYYPEALVVTGEGAAEFLSHPKVSAAIGPEDRHMSETLASFGFEPGRPPVIEPPSLQSTLVARDGDELDVGGITLRFIRTTGHAPGKIVVYAPEKRVLILSDSLGFRFPGGGVFPPFFTGYEDYIATLKRLRDLNPVVIGPAHQGPIKGPEATAVFEEFLQMAEQLRARICTDPREGDEIATELFTEFYRDGFLIYSAENIMNCCKLLVRRARE